MISTSTTLLLESATNQQGSESVDENKTQSDDQTQSRVSADNTTEKPDEQQVTVVNETTTIVTANLFTKLNDKPTDDSYKDSKPESAENKSVKISADETSVTENSANALMCRICHCEETSEEYLITPCYCSGTLRFVHQSCLQQWLKSNGKYPFIFVRFFENVFLFKL
jgi:hypothetical protein